MRKARISAVIPTFNRAGTLARAIRSALAQRYPADELIVVDDGSTDETPQVVRSFGNAVQYIRQANGGVSSARNAGASAARSEWIAYLDSDDYWLPTHLERMAAAIEATHGDCAWYFCDVAIESASNVRTTYWKDCGLRLDNDFELHRDGSALAFMRTQPALLQASVLRREAYFAVGALPIGLRTREDTLLFFRLALRYPVCAVAGVGTVMMNDGGGRLTQVFDSRHGVFQDATIALYRSVLDDGVFKSPSQRNHVRTMLSYAYAEAAVHNARRGRLRATAKLLGVAALSDPFQFVACVAGKVHRKLIARRSIAGGGLGERHGIEGKEG